MTVRVLYTKYIYGQMLYIQININYTYDREDVAFKFVPATVLWDDAIRINFNTSCKFWTGVGLTPCKYIFHWPFDIDPYKTTGKSSYPFSHK